MRLPGGAVAAEPLPSDKAGSGVEQCEHGELTELTTDRGGTRPVVASDVDAGVDWGCWSCLPDGTICLKSGNGVRADPPRSIGVLQADN